MHPPFGKRITLKAQINGLSFPYYLPCTFLPSHSDPGDYCKTSFCEGLKKHLCVSTFFFWNPFIALERSPVQWDEGTWASYIVLDKTSLVQPAPRQFLSWPQTSPKTGFANSPPGELPCWPVDSWEIINDCCFQQWSFWMVCYEK